MISSFSFILILGSILQNGTATEENDFNCPEECGIYSEKDPVGPTLHNGCTAMKESEKCKAKFVVKKKKKRKKKKKANTRIVGGVETKYPMPWMVLINIDGSQCGGTLINSQFVLTAAHCFCGGVMLCNRFIGQVKKGEPVQIKEDAKVGEKVKVFIGLTAEGSLGVAASEIFRTESKNQTYHVEKIFVHPLLGTSEEYIMTPDIALIKLAKQVPNFNSFVRPICLSTKDTQERPICPDMSRDKMATQQEKDKGLVHDRGGGKILGGCATVAGWGNRYAFGEMEEKDSTCTTDFADLGPDKIEHCQPYWSVNGKEVENCTKEDIRNEDLTKPCKLFAQELEFNKALHQKLGTNTSKARYLLSDINDLSRRQKSPIEIVIKLKKKTKTKIVFHCGITKFTTEEKQKTNGWCATKLDQRDKIQNWGFCNDACTDDRETFMFANMNLLTDDECEVLFENHESLYWNKEYELCVGKKHQFPKALISFKRTHKRKSVKKKEIKQAKEVGLLSGFKPTRYQYSMNKKYTRVSLGTPDKYPYDWFLGGVDTCQGDSGGPLWRNVKIGEKIRATQIGVVSRGKGCANFNAPALFGSVKMNFGWFKEIVEKEMSGKGYCPK